MEEEWTIQFDPDFERSFRKWLKRHPESCDQAIILNPLLPREMAE